MRVLTFTLLFAAPLWAASVPDLQALVGAVLKGGGPRGSVKPVNTRIPAVESIKPEGPESGTLRTRIRYGPYQMPKYTKKTLMSVLTKEGGMYDSFSKNATKPCSDCTITRFRGNLVYPDGTEANVNTGAWVHHLIMMTSGPRRTALTCGKISGAHSEPFYTFGNERLELHFDNSGPVKAGYYLGHDDTLSMIVELMNMVDAPKDTYLVIEYEYFPGKPAGYLDAQPAWLAMCELGQVKPLSNNTFTLKSTATPSPVEGPILLAGGHVHDGGSHVEIFIDNKLVCDSVTAYGERPEYVQSSGASGLELMRGMNGMTEMAHISGQTQCHNLGELKKGTPVSLKAYYDFKTHHGMTDLEGKLSEVMGLGMLYVGRPMP